MTRTMTCPIVFPDAQVKYDNTCCIYCYQPIKTLKDHQIVCPELIIDCSLGCGVYFKRKDLYVHYNTCNRYYWRCNESSRSGDGYCNVLVSRSDLLSHWLYYHASFTIDVCHNNVNIYRLNMGKPNPIGTSIIEYLPKEIRYLIYSHLCGTTSIDTINCHKISYSRDDHNWAFYRNQFDFLCNSSLFCFQDLLLLALTCKDFFNEIRGIKLYRIGITLELQKPKQYCPLCQIELLPFDWTHVQSCKNYIAQCPFCPVDFHVSEYYNHLEKYHQDYPMISFSPFGLCHAKMQKLT